VYDDRVKGHKRAILAGVAVALLAAGQASAEETANQDRLELGTYLGFHIFSETNEIGAFDQAGTLVPTSPKSSLVFGIRVGYQIISRLVVEGELALAPTKSRDDLADLFVFGWRAHALVPILTKGKIIPFALVGVGALTLSSSNNAVLNEDSDFTFHAGAGVKYRAGKHWGLRLDAKVLLPPSSEDTGWTYDFEVTLGAFATFGGRGKATAAPTAPTDDDGDGIVGAADKCPERAEDRDGYQDTDGCPEEDNDADGIPDVNDKCPEKVETKNGIDDEDGCPEEDGDGDGLVGSKDACPTEAEDKDNYQDEDGCPDLDNDGDGIPDANDKCPDEPETKNGFADDDGCRDEIPVEVKKFTGVIQGINFKKNSAEILKDSNKVLDRAAKVLNDNPSVRVEIQGHTDDTGARDRNILLSEQRAASVKAYLVNAGVAEGRLTTVGYGPNKPIDPAATRAARAKNRRVEFQLRVD
jgi:OOP family OmpA-OmpF porin